MQIKKKLTNIGIDSLREIRFLGAVLLCLCSASMSAQDDKVSSIIDTTQIRIGEQIKYTFNVETDSSSLVHFPEGQTFSPLEMVRSFKTDSVKKGNRLILQKIYALTQFDSGAYTIPKQRIQINDRAFFTDSFAVAVGTVKVDTLTQKLYEIKDLLEVEKGPYRIWGIVWWLVLTVVVFLVLLIGGLVYFFFIRKKPLTEEEKIALLPPFDRAIQELKRLENSRYIIHDEYKKYYSELTDIVRSYLEEEVHITALESTTDELINKLELLADAGNLELSQDTIKQFKTVLQTADLVKFARSKPESSIAETDRKSVEQIVIKTKEALPEPTEEELLKNEEYLEELALKKQKKKWLYGGLAFLAVILIGLGIAIKVYGFTYVKDTIFGHPTKELLEEKDWVKSNYGFPPINIETPKVLLRKEVALSQEVAETIKEMHAFSYTNEEGLFSISVICTNYNSEEEPDFKKTLDAVISNFEKLGAKNITTKQEEINTPSGIKGLKFYGSGKFKIPSEKELVRGKYALINFGGKGFSQQLILTWLADDIYAEEIIEKIINSVEVKTE